MEIEVSPGAPSNDLTERVVTALFCPGPRANPLSV
jgi:hypothetical protein